MKKAGTRFWIVAGVLLLTLWAFSHAQAAGEPVRGTVQEGGFGKFGLRDKGDSNWLFYLSSKATVYKPDDWRPAVGDEVLVNYIDVQRRGSSIAQVTSVELLKAGPNTVRIKSPVAVEIVETGRSGYRVKILSTGAVVKFNVQRGMEIVPVGWVPAPGEKATITFTMKAWGFSLVYALEKVEKAGAR